MAVLQKRICDAAQADDVKMLKRWLRKAPHLRNRGLNTNAIHRAAGNGNNEILGILIEFGCNLQFKLNGHAPLSTAIWSSCESTTELLVKSKIDINAQDSESLNSALHLATRRPFRIGMRILLEAGASVDIRNQIQSTPLLIAAQNGDSLSVKLLLQHRANTSFRDQGGYSALQLAAVR